MSEQDYTQQYNNIKNLIDFLSYITPDNITQYDSDLILKISDFAKEVLKFDDTGESSYVLSDELESTDENNNCFVTPTIQPIIVNQQIPVDKHKDVLLDNFLNNTLNLGNYHYLSSIDVNRIHNYCDNSFIY